MTAFKKKTSTKEKGMKVINVLSGMVLAVVFVAIFLLSVWIISAPAASAGDPGKGKEIYAKSCSSCHGPEGKGDGAAAAAINPKPTNLADKATVSKLDDAALTNAIVKGGAATGKSPLMPGFSQLKDQEVKDLVAYIRSVAK